MLVVGSLGGLGAVGYSCSGTVCRATSPTQQALFIKLQKELNRVRPMFGLPADVTVDGVIGTSTVAKLMKLAVKFVGDRNSSRFDRVFDKYAFEFGGDLPTPSVLASDALNVVQALERDGLTMQHYWAREDAVSSGSPIASTPLLDLRNLIRPTKSAATPQITVGPTAPAPTPVLPTTFQPKFRGLAIAGGVLAALAIGGLVIGLAKRRPA